MRAFLRAASAERNETLYIVAVHTGLGQGELLGLRWTNTDLEAGRLVVRRALKVTDHGLDFGPPKNKASRRTVSLTRTAGAALRAHRALQNEERLRLGDLWRDHDLTFRFHDLRLTCATLLLSKNVNPKIVQEMLGHANISQTMDTYSHVLPNMQDEAASAMDVALSE